MAEPSAPEATTSLGTTGTVYVTMAAARSYAGARGLGEEEARRELTELLLDAKHQPGADRPPYESWRFRRRSADVEVSATVSREGRLAVIVAVQAHVRGARG